MFIDTAKIKIKAETGGTAPSPSTGRNTWRPAGPTAATVGRGGSIVFQVDDNLSTLADFRYKRNAFFCSSAIPINRSV